MTPDVRARAGRAGQLERARGRAALRPAVDRHRARGALPDARGPELRGRGEEAQRRARRPRARRRAAAEEREAEARAAPRRALEAEIEAAQEPREAPLARRRASFIERLRRARDDLRDAQARLRAKKLDADGAARRGARHRPRRGRGRHRRAARARVASGQLRRGRAPREPVRAPELRRGARVWVTRLRAEAEVVEVLADGAVRVAAGALKLTVPASELRASRRPNPRRAPVRAVRDGRPDRGPPRRGDRAEAVAGRWRNDASGAASRRATTPATCAGSASTTASAWRRPSSTARVGGGQPVVFLLHGHGTGALRDAIRKELARSPYVARFRGGDARAGRRRRDAGLAD